MTLEFVKRLGDVTLEFQFSPAELEAFRNPQELSPSPSEDPDLLLSISNYITNLNASQDIYINNRSNIQGDYTRLMISKLFLRCKTKGCATGCVR